MKNYIQPGDVLTLTAPTGGVVSGLAYLIGAIVVIASADIAEGLPFEGAVEGVFDVDAASGEAWTEGAVVYWDDTAKEFTITSTDNTKAGVAVEAKGSSATTGRVMLIPAI